MRLRRRQLLCIIDALRFRLLEASEHAKDVLDFPAEHYREALTWAERNLEGRKQRGALRPDPAPAPPDPFLDEILKNGERELADRDNQTVGWLRAIHRAGEGGRNGSE